MVFTSSIACIHVDWVPAANPYRPEQIVVLLLLLFGLIAWRRVRPKPSWPVAGYMAAGSLATMSATCWQTCTTSTVEPTAEIILQASTALAVCIYIEVVRTHWQRRRSVLAHAQAVEGYIRRNSSE